MLYRFLKKVINLYLQIILFSTKRVNWAGPLFSMGAFWCLIVNVRYFCVEIKIEPVSD